MRIVSINGCYYADVELSAGVVTVKLYQLDPRQHLGTVTTDKPLHVVYDAVYELLRDAPDPSRHVWVPELGRVIDKLN